MKTLVCLLLAVSLALTGAAALASAPVAPTALAYEGPLSMMHFAAPETAEDDGGAESFRVTLAAWKVAHPGITVEETVLSAEDCGALLRDCGGADSLPDVFLIHAGDAAAWAAEGLAMDLTDILQASPYRESYRSACFLPFTAGDGMYGFPALAGGTCTVVIYDRELWAEAGFGSFPAGWDEVGRAAEYFSGKGIDTIAFGGGEERSVSGLISTLASRYTGAEWFTGLASGSGAALTDTAFVRALTTAQQLFTGTGIFNEDFAVITGEDACEYFLAGDAAAMIGSTRDAASVRQALADDGDERLGRIGFAVLPQPADAVGMADSQSGSLSWAVALRPGLAEDPDKLNAAVDLAQELTGPAFSGYAAEHFALAGLTDPGEADLSRADAAAAAFYRWFCEDSTLCGSLDTCLPPEAWDALYAGVVSVLCGEMQPAQAAEEAQAALEAAR